MTTAPIKDRNKISEMKHYFLDAGQYRNHALLIMGMYSALRISDMLSLKWGDIYDFDRMEYKRYLEVIEKKTKKKATIALHSEVINAMDLLLKTLSSIHKELYIFKSQKAHNNPITRNQAYKIIKNASADLKIDGNISCHSLRKTFGYQAFTQGASIVTIMHIYNHSSFDITKRYLCIDQDDKDKVYLNLSL